jgi:hypothetical protein
VTIKLVSGRLFYVGLNEASKIFFDKLQDPKIYVVNLKKYKFLVTRKKPKGDTWKK